MIGIGITTFNRSKLLDKLLLSVQRFTKAPYFIVIASDGSTDDTRLVGDKYDVAVIGDSNRGIAWNKNRALYALRNYTSCKTIVLLEDDTRPIYPRWENQWTRAVDKFGYVTFAHPKIADAILAGEGTPDNPYACTKITSQCAAVSIESLDQIGYFDTRFQGYGVEDGEWTTRLRTAGFGHVRIADDTGTIVKANCMITGGVQTFDAVSYRDNRSVERNRAIFNEIRNDPVPRPAWRTDEDQALLRDEIESQRSRIEVVRNS